MRTRRDPKLDRYLNQGVEIEFTDRSTEKGVLEYGRPYAPGLPDSTYYSLFRFGKGVLRFRKSCVKKIKPIK